MKVVKIINTSFINSINQINLKTRYFKNQPLKYDYVTFTGKNKEDSLEDKIKKSILEGKEFDKKHYLSNLDEFKKFMKAFSNVYEELVKLRKEPSDLKNPLKDPYYKFCALGASMQLGENKKIFSELYIELQSSTNKEDHDLRHNFGNIIGATNSYYILCHYDDDKNIKKKTKKR